MRAMSLGLITTAARLGFPRVFVIGDDWLCYGGWADAWLRCATSILNGRQRSSSTRDFPHVYQTWERWASSAS